MKARQCIIQPAVFLTLITISLLPATPTAAAVLMDCLDGDTTADLIERGFYITSYPGTSLTSVDMYFSGLVSGEYTIQLTARADRYDGTVIGSAQATVTLTDDPDDLYPAEFIFPSSPVTLDAIVTFTMELIAGPDVPYYGVDPDDTSCSVVQTHGTTPPLDSPRWNGVRLRIQGDPEVADDPVTWGTIKVIYQ